MSLQLLFGLLLSLGIGLSLGLIGAGGSIVTVPVLIYVLGVDPHEAVAMSLAVVGATSLVGAVSHARKGAVRGGAAALFAGSGVLSAWFGSRLTYLVPGDLLLVLFALLMLVVAARMLLGGQPDETAHARSSWRMVAAGLGVGLLTGFLGVGGGFLIVPALVLFAGLTMREAVGTSLVVIAINCAAGLAGHWSYGFDLRLTVLVAALAAAGVLLGTAFSHRVPAPRLRRLFAVFVLAVAVFLLVRNQGAIRHLVTAALLATPGLPSLVDDQGDHAEGGDRVGPPPAEGGVEANAAQGDDR